MAEYEIRILTPEQGDARYATHEDLAEVVALIPEEGGGGGVVDAESVRDIISAALVAGSDVTITTNDALNTITIGFTGVSTVAGRSGTVLLTGDDVADSGTRVFMSPAERAKLSGVAAGATANDTDANLKNRANHTGTQSASTITGLSAVALSGSYDDLTGTVPISALPPLAVNEVFVVASEASMLSLTAQRGDMAIRTDNGITYVLAADAPLSLSNWKSISASGSVVSVSGKTGAVSLVKADVGLDNVDNTSDANKPISTATQTALNTKAPTNSPAFTGTPTGITKAHVGLGNVDNTSDANKPISTATQTALNEKAADSTAVKTTGAQAIGGVKTFTSPPIVPTPVSTTDATNKTYVDTLIGGIRSAVITNPATQSWASVDIRDDGSSTASWVNRLEFFFRVAGAPTSELVTWINEYGEIRGMPAKSNTVGLRVFAAKDATALTARSLTVPVLEVADKRDGVRNTIFAVYADGSMRWGGYKVTIGPSTPTSMETGQIHILTEV